MSRSPAVQPIDFTELYARYSRDVFRFVLYLCGNREDAEDITSETFVRAFASSESIEMPTVKSYLFAIARNLFLMGLRSRHRRALDPPGPNLPDASPGPQQQFEHRSTLNFVWNRVSSLPEPDRSALLMRALHSMPYEEIARALKISVSSAKVKVHRARLLLMQQRKEGSL